MILKFYVFFQKRTTVCVDMLDEEDDDDIDDNVNIRKSLELGKPKRSKPLHIVFSRKVEKNERFQIPEVIE